MKREQFRPSSSSSWLNPSLTSQKPKGIKADAEKVTKGVQNKLRTARPIRRFTSTSWVKPPLISRQSNEKTKKLTSVSGFTPQLITQQQPQEIIEKITDVKKEFQNKIRPALSVKKATLPAWDNPLLIIQKQTKEMMESIAGIREAFIENLRPVLSFQKAISDMYEEHVKMVAEVFKSISIPNIDSEVITERMRVTDQTLSLLSKEGWVIPTHYIFETNFDAIDFINDLDNAEINKRMVSFYIRSNYKYLFKELEILENETSKKYKNQVAKVRKILEADTENYTLCMPVLFSILDGTFMETFRTEINQYEKIPKRIILNNNNIKSVVKHHNLNDKEGISFTNIIINNLFKAITLKLEFVDFKEDEQKFSRHSVMHGSISPDNYPFIEFLKLVNICSLFALVTNAI